MRSKVCKILAIAIAAAMIACAGAGCAKNDNKAQQSSAAAATSTEESKTEESKTEESKTEESKTEESKTEESKTEESKTEESKTEESKTEESKTEESADESSEESAEESEDESSEESAEESEEESSEEESEASVVTEADVAGVYEYNVGGVYIGLILEGDGSLACRSANGFTAFGKWELADGKVTLRSMGGAEVLEFVDGKLVSDDSREYLPVEALAVEDNTDAVITAAALGGTWVSQTEDGVEVSFILNADGTGTYKIDEQEFTAVWDVEGGSLSVHVEGGAIVLKVGIDSSTGSMTFVDSENNVTYSLNKDAE